MRCWTECAIAGLLAMNTAVACAQPIAVEAVNASTPTLCAETDNVYVKFISSKVRRFTVEAAHPIYLPTLTADSTAPDFTDCKMSSAADAIFTPRQVTLHDDGNWRLLGFTYPNFWRATQVPVHVGGTTETGLHLLQLWTRGRARDEEVLVLYPADGYWRARPLAPLQLGWQFDPILPTAYGSSFLVGPVEQSGRPLVDLQDVTFDASAGAFRLTFARGGGAMLRIDRLDTGHISLDVTFDRTFTAPFAALRSMYVSDLEADAARVAWRPPNARHRIERKIDAFRQSPVSDFWLGRRRPSRHNTSAPDMTVGNFRAAQ